MDILIDILLFKLPEAVFMLYLTLFYMGNYKVDFKNKTHYISSSITIGIMIVSFFIFENYIISLGILNQLINLVAISFIIQIIIYRKSVFKSYGKLALSMLKMTGVMFSSEFIVLPISVGLTYGFMNIANILTSMQSEPMQMFFVSIPLRIVQFLILIVCFAWRDYKNEKVI